MVVAVLGAAEGGAVELVVVMIDAFDESVNGGVALSFPGYLSVRWSCIVLLCEHLGDAGAWHEFKSLKGLVLRCKMLFLVVLDLTNKEVALISFGIEFIAVEDLSGASVVVFVDFTELLHGSCLHVDDELCCRATGVPHSKGLRALSIGIVGVPTAPFIGLWVHLNLRLEVACTSSTMA